MSADKTQAQRAAQAGSPGEAARVGLEVGGVHNKDDLSWLDLWALNPETRAYLKAYRRNAACSHAPQRREGAGDGSQEITTPEKLRKLQRALYRKAKALNRTAEYLAMKRLGKPDTGNPSVRFDEGSESVTSTDNCGRFNLTAPPPAHSTSRVNSPGRAKVRGDGSSPTENSDEPLQKKLFTDFQRLTKIKSSDIPLISAFFLFL